MKKISFIIIMLLALFCISNVEAASESNFIDMQAYTNIYKLSEDSDVELPFIKFFNEKAAFDKKLDKSGLTVGANAIEITDDVNGMQTIIASDTVDIKGSVEYAAILAPNVMISGTIEKDIFILAQSVFITDTANISGDIVVMAESIEMKGVAHSNFIANSTDFKMAGKVHKDFRVCSQEMNFEETDIKGDIYIETDSQINISDKYENAVVHKIQTNVVSEAEKKSQITQEVISVITSVILFTLFNMLTRKIKPELFKNLSAKAMAHSSFAIIMGVLTLTTIPIVVMLTLVFSMFGLGVVTTPLFVVYIALIVVIIALAKFIVGSSIYELVKDKLKANSLLKETGLLLGIFAALYLICYLPYISWFSTMTIVLLSAGIVTTGLLKKQ